MDDITRRGFLAAGAVVAAPYILKSEDKAGTIDPTPTRGVSALMTGNKTALIPEGTERMKRRKLHKLPLVAVTNGHTTPKKSHAHNGCSSHRSEPPGLFEVESLHEEAFALEPVGCGR